MKTPSGRMALLLILICFGLFMAFALTPLVLAPFGIFAGLAHGIHSAGMGVWHFRPWFPFFPLWGFSLFFFVLWIVVLVWVYRDAESRGMNGVLWALLVFFGNLIGLLIFLIVRQDHPLPRRSPSGGQAGSGPKAASSTSPPSSGGTQAAASQGSSATSAGTAASAVEPAPVAPSAAQTLTCPKCRQPIEKSYAYCPYCGATLQPVCKNCGKSVDTAWKTCPYCGTALKSE